MSRTADRRVVLAVVTLVSAVIGALGEASALTQSATPTTTTTATTTSSSVPPVVPTAVKLPAPAVVGPPVAVETRIAQTTAAGPFEIAVTMSTAVTAVNAADGSYTTRSTIGTVDVPVGAELAGNGVNALVTRSFEQSFTATGAAIPQASTIIDAASLTPEQQQSWSCAGRCRVDGERRLPG